MDETKSVMEANPADYDGLLVPGGFINPDMLRQSAEARDFVRAFDSADKPIATLCHGPWQARTFCPSPKRVPVQHSVR